MLIAPGTCLMGGISDAFDVPVLIHQWQEDSQYREAQTVAHQRVEEGSQCD